MGNFEALITARLDAAQAKAQLDALTKQRTVDIKVNYKNASGGGRGGGGRGSASFDRRNAEIAANQTLTWLNRNTAAAEKFGATMRSLADEQRGAFDAKSLANFNKEVKLAQSKAGAEGLLGKLKETTKEFNHLDAEIASNKTLAWLNKNTKANKKFGESLKDLAEKQRNAYNADDLAKYSKQVKFIQSQAEAQNLTGRSWSTDLKNGLAQVAKFASAYQIIQRVMWQTPREMIQAVQDIDAANIELRKVSDASSGEISQYFDEATESAKRYGVAVSDVIQSTADWSRLGYDFKQAKELSDATNLLQRVGDNMTQETASKGIISALQGFQLEVGDVGHIVDAYNEVANNFAIDTEGIAEAVERSASSMTAAGNTMEETIALATAANKVVNLCLVA